MPADVWLLLLAVPALVVLPQLGRALGPRRGLRIGLGRDDAGRYWRLPLSYHIVEGRWIHTNGAFLAPDTDDFWSKSTVWNETCLFCHNTRPSKRPLPRRGGRPGYDTEVVELGIACEACHGPGEEHVRANHNPARRLS